MEVSIDACKNPFWLITRVFDYMNKSIDLPASIGGKSSLMAAKRGERIVSALNSLALDGLSLPGDEENVEALIEEYFDDSADDSGSDDSDNELVRSHTLF